MMTTEMNNPMTPTYTAHAVSFTRLSALLVSVAALMSGCVINGGGGSDRYEEDVYVEDVYVEDDIAEREEEVFEEREVIEETEETTTTTTTVENPPVEEIPEVSCSPEDQGFENAEPVEVFTIDPPEGCVWSEMSEDINPELGLGFVDVMSDDEYVRLFDCGDAVAGSDVNWDTEVVVYLSGWVPAGSEPNFEWSVSAESGEVVLGLVSAEICTDELEFYQTMFIAPRREMAPRVISCVMPSDC